jgi:magnesium-transporting ATPase (P-type)
MVKRDDKMAEVAERLELDFDLIGATAIEDKLQDDVDKAISAMKKAGIRVWVLTGDKVETAINIGFSCQLLNDKMELYIINGGTKQECLE